jgi:hypothetical protein
MYAILSKLVLTLIIVVFAVGMSLSLTNQLIYRRELSNLSL